MALTLWLALLAWLIGRVLTDRFAWSQFLWWMPTSAVLAAAALGLLLAIRTARTPRRKRRRIVIWAAAALLIFAYLSLMEHRLLHGTPPLPPQSSLTIAHWNMTLDNNADIPGLMSAVAALDADVLAITTPPGEVRRLLHEQADASNGALKVIYVWPMLLASRVPIANWRILVSTDGMSITQVDFDAGATLGGPMTVCLVDLPSNPRRPRMAMAREARRLLDEFKAPVPDICIGDFNITRGSASIDTLFPGMIDAYDIAGHGCGATFPRRLPLYHIDHVLVNEASGLRATRYDIIDAGQSRHRAQKAWIVGRP